MSKCKYCQRAADEPICDDCVRKDAVLCAERCEREIAAVRAAAKWLTVDEIIQVLCGDGPVGRLATLARAMIEKYGRRAQLDQLQEECAELIAAVSHERRGRPMGIVELVGELVDVEIMVAQIRHVLPRELYDAAMREKLDRLQRRVEGK